MPTVILGGGIMGASTAFYLSQTQPTEEIHIVESAAQLFSAASGYGAGFLARDWFAPALAPLGALSFDLHESLAAEYGGARQWGYMKGTAMSLASSDASKKGGPRGDDWLRAGTSRAETSAGSSGPVRIEQPGWLTKQRGMVAEKISDEGTVAQVDPLRLCRFLMAAATARGAKLHQPAKATSVITKNGVISGVRIAGLESQTEYTVPCTNLIVCAGSWTPRVFEELFPSSRVSISINPLAGYSLVFRSPRYNLEHERKLYGGRSHAVFTTHPETCGFSPEMFSREGGEIYIAGLNSTQIPLPERAEGTAEYFDPKEMERLKKVAVRLMGKLAPGSDAADDQTPTTDDLEIIREGLCFRPAAARGVPIVARVEDRLLGGVKTGPQGGVFIATGHGPWGISLSLGTGKVVAEMVAGTQPTADLRGLNVESDLSRL